jgi:CBS domain-containing protein
MEGIMNIQSLLNQKSNEVFEIHPDASLSECIAALNERKIGALMVIDANRELMGIISERDILRLAYAKQCQICEIPVRQVMTPRQRLVVGSPQDGIESVMQRMTENRIRHLPIMQNDKLVGMVSIGDVVKELWQMATHENQQMKDYVLGRYS